MDSNSKNRAMQLKQRLCNLLIQGELIDLRAKEFSLNLNVKKNKEIEEALLNGARMIHPQVDEGRLRSGRDAIELSTWVNAAYSLYQKCLTSSDNNKRELMEIVKRRNLKSLELDTGKERKLKFEKAQGAKIRAHFRSQELNAQEDYQALSYFRSKW